MAASNHLSRRQWLRRTAGSFGAVLLPSLGRGAKTVAPRAKACIMVFLQGGISHYESFDPKPDAPSEVRGEFGSIATSVPGVRLCEYLPLLAQRMQRFSIIRSVNHYTPDHLQAIHMTLTGNTMPGANIERNNHNASPTMGAVVAKLRGPNQPDVPGYVCIPHRDQLGHRLHYGSAAFLGSSFEPIDSGLLPDRADAPFTPPPNLALRRGQTVDQLRERLTLVEQLESGPLFVPLEAAPNAFHHQAVGLLGRGAAGRAFDVNQEPVALRRRYGDDAMGQEAILARRLTESGVPFTLVNFSLDQIKGQDWDTHENNFKLMKNTLLPPMDRAVSTLLDDLETRGLLDTTVVAVTGEFGRTPRINANAGRDHWPNVFSIMLAGGGIKPGLVIGSSTRAGDEPRDRPVHLFDVQATIYHLLGVPTNHLFRDASGRPLPVMAEGKPIPELL